MSMEEPQGSDLEDGEICEDTEEPENSRSRRMRGRHVHNDGDDGEYFYDERKNPRYRRHSTRSSHYSSRRGGSRKQSRAQDYHRSRSRDQVAIRHVRQEAVSRERNTITPPSRSTSHHSNSRSSGKSRSTSVGSGGSSSRRTSYDDGKGEKSRDPNLKSKDRLFPTDSTSPQSSKISVSAVTDEEVLADNDTLPPGTDVLQTCGGKATEEVVNQVDKVPTEPEVLPENLRKEKENLEDILSEEDSVISVEIVQNSGATIEIITLESSDTDEDQLDDISSKNRSNLSREPATPITTTSSPPLTSISTPSSHSLSIETSLTSSSGSDSITTPSSQNLSLGTHETSLESNTTPSTGSREAYQTTSESDVLNTSFFSAVSSSSSLESESLSAEKSSDWLSPASKNKNIAEVRAASRRITGQGQPSGQPISSATEKEKDCHKELVDVVQRNQEDQETRKAVDKQNDNDGESSEEDEIELLRLRTDLLFSLLAKQDNAAKAASTRAAALKLQEDKSGPTLSDVDSMPRFPESVHPVSKRIVVQDINETRTTITIRNDNSSPDTTVSRDEVDDEIEETLRAVLISQQKVREMKKKKEEQVVTFEQEVPYVSFTPPSSPPPHECGIKSRNQLSMDSSPTFSLKRKCSNEYHSPSLSPPTENPNRLTPNHRIVRVTEEPIYISPPISRPPLTPLPKVRFLPKNDLRKKLLKNASLRKSASAHELPLPFRAPVPTNHPENFHFPEFGVVDTDWRQITNPPPKDIINDDDVTIRRTVTFDGTSTESSAVTWTEPISVQIPQVDLPPFQQCSPRSRNRNYSGESSPRTVLLQQTNQVSPSIQLQPARQSLSAPNLPLRLPQQDLSSVRMSPSSLHSMPFQSTPTYGRPSPISPVLHGAAKIPRMSSSISHRISYDSSPISTFETSVSMDNRNLFKEVEAMFANSGTIPPVAFPMIQRISQPSTQITTTEPFVEQNIPNEHESVFMNFTTSVSDSCPTSNLSFCSVPDKLGFPEAAAEKIANKDGSANVPVEKASSLPSPVINTPSVSTVSNFNSNPIPVKSNLPVAASVTITNKDGRANEPVEQTSNLLSPVSKRSSVSTVQSLNLSPIPSNSNLSAAASPTITSKDGRANEPVEQASNLSSPVTKKPVSTVQSLNSSPIPSNSNLSLAASATITSKDGRTTVPVEKASNLSSPGTKRPSESTVQNLNTSPTPINSNLSAAASATITSKDGRTNVPVEKASNLSSPGTKRPSESTVQNLNTSPIPSNSNLSATASPTITSKDGRANEPAEGKSSLSNPVAGELEVSTVPSLHSSPIRDELVPPKTSSKTAIDKGDSTDVPVENRSSSVSGEPSVSKVSSLNSSPIDNKYDRSSTAAETNINKDGRVSVPVENNSIVSNSVIAESTDRTVVSSNSNTIPTKSDPPSTVPETSINKHGSTNVPVQDKYCLSKPAGEPPVSTVSSSNSNPIDDKSGSPVTASEAANTNKGGCIDKDITCNIVSSSVGNSSVTSSNTLISTPADVLNREQNVTQTTNPTLVSKPKMSTPPPIANPAATKSYAAGPISQTKEGRVPRKRTISQKRRSVSQPAKRPAIAGSLPLRKSPNAINKLIPKPLVPRSLPSSPSINKPPVRIIIPVRENDSTSNSDDSSTEENQIQKNEKRNARVFQKSLDDFLKRAREQSTKKFEEQLKPAVRSTLQVLSRGGSPDPSKTRVTSMVDAQTEAESNIAVSGLAKQSVVSPKDAARKPQTSFPNSASAVAKFPVSVAGGGPERQKSSGPLSNVATSKAVIEDLTRRIVESRDQLSLSAKEKELLQSRQKLYQGYREIQQSLTQNIRLVNLDRNLDNQIVDLQKKLDEAKRKQQVVRTKATALNQLIKEKSRSLMSTKVQCSTLSREVKRLGERIIGEKIYKVTDLFAKDILGVIKTLETLSAKQPQSVQLERGAIFQQLLGNFEIPPELIPNFAGSSRNMTETTNAVTIITSETSERSRSASGDSSIMSSSRATQSDNSSNSSGDVCKRCRCELNNDNENEPSTSSSPKRSTSYNPEWARAGCLTKHSTSDMHHLESVKLVSSQPHLPSVGPSSLFEHLFVLGLTGHPCEGHVGSSYMQITIPLELGIVGENGNGRRLDPMVPLCLESLLKGTCFAEECPHQHI